MKVEVGIPTETDIQSLIADLLPADRMEVEAMGYDPEWAIRHSIEQSAEVFSFLGDGRLGSIAGVVPGDMTMPARPWMLSTSAILCRPKEVMRTSKIVYSAWLDHYGYLTNYVDQRHIRAVYWLRWLGARFTPEPKFGPYQRPFYLFELGEP